MTEHCEHLINTLFPLNAALFQRDNDSGESGCVHLSFFFILGASAKDPPLKLTSMLIGISLIKILVFYKIFFYNELRVKFLSSLKKKIGEKFRVGINLDRKSYVSSYVSPYFTCKY